MRQRTLDGVAWMLGVVVTVLPIVAWLQFHNGRAIESLYTFFPLLGMIAFGLMWTHFVLGALRRYNDVEQLNARYMQLSMVIVLALILLHPGLLWLALYQDGLGLPPLSHYMAYAGQALAVTLGSLGLAIFLMYEGKRLWKDTWWWKYIEQLQIVGMIAIFIHALQLGGEVTNTWFYYVWLIYGATFVGAVVYSYWHDNREKSK